MHQRSTWTSRPRISDSPLADIGNDSCLFASSFHPSLKGVCECAGETGHAGEAAAKTRRRLFAASNVTRSSSRPVLLRMELDGRCIGGDIGSEALAREKRHAKNSLRQPSRRPCRKLFGACTSRVDSAHANNMHDHQVLSTCLYRVGSRHSCTLYFVTRTQSLSLSLVISPPPLPPLPDRQPTKAAAGPPSPPAL